MTPYLHPIIYVRGYAKSGNERDETTANPFCGFNIGSTGYRAFGEKEAPARKFVFESPVVRLSSDYKYHHLYQNGLGIAAPRGKRWFFTHRVAEEDSCACRTHQQLTDDSGGEGRAIYLSTVFLSSRARVNRQRPSMAYAMTIGVKVPDYQVDKIFWPDQHYEGSYLFRDTLIIELIPPGNQGDKWNVKYGWRSISGELPVQAALLEDEGLSDGKVKVTVPFTSTKKPGIAGAVRLVASVWNDARQKEE